MKLSDSFIVSKLNTNLLSLYSANKELCYYLSFLYSRTMTSYLIKNWRDYFLKNPTIEISNSLLQPIRNSVSPSTDFAELISEISKNAGITLLALDASEGNLQLIHHPTVLGGNWANKSKKIVAILGFEDDATPIKIIEKSIKKIKREDSFNFKI
ncbi:MAG: hypothetical protein ACK524_05485 [Planctomyces sp.]